VHERYLTISVDDGHPADSRTAELLRACALKATFYVPATNPEREVLAIGELRAIAESFEIGAHTFSHRSLAGLSDEAALKEIRDGKEWLENRLGDAVISFCYPRGKFTRRTPALVREAGLAGARTCMFNLNSLPRDRYLAGVSTHAHSHARHVQLRHALLERNFRGVHNFASIHRLADDWATHFAAALAWVDGHGGVAHLYLHSWEIDHHGEWGKLRAVLEHAAGYRRLTRITNGELFRLCKLGEHEGRAPSSRGGRLSREGSVSEAPPPRISSIVRR
jgi:peptidoglycan/xylan/chitin deacetylase (PgdA/CDA1 family)